MKITDKIDLPLLVTDSKHEISYLANAVDRITDDLNNTATSIDILNFAINDRKKIEEELQKALMEQESIMNTVPDIIYMLDMNTKLYRWNKKMEIVTGLTPEELLGISPYQLIAKEGKKIIAAALKNTLSKGYAEVEAHIVGKSGEAIPYHWTIALIKDSQNKTVGFTGVAHDISKYKQAEKALRDSKKRYKELSIIDDLTKLNNSRHFHSQLKLEVERAFRYKRPSSLLLLDIDNFKKYNDKYGHLEGDKVLAIAGKIIQKCIRTTDSAYRYGGEEFTVILPETERKGAKDIAERIRIEFVKNDFTPKPDEKIKITLSIGISEYRYNEELTEFIERADHGMYMAKNQGKNRIFFADSLS